MRLDVWWWAYGEVWGGRVKSRVYNICIQNVRQKFRQNPPRKIAETTLCHDIEADKRNLIK